MTYDNSSYWIHLHKELPGALRSVGWPGLSEEYNKLKYRSESESVIEVLDAFLARSGKKEISVLDIGAIDTSPISSRGTWIRKGLPRPSRRSTFRKTPSRLPAR
jgi:hypothetical protein